jgi:hypothetical protein
MSLDLIAATGTYSGNDGTTTITLGWQPALVMTFIDKGGGPTLRGIGIKCPDMAGDDTLILSTDAVWLTANGITLTSTGFTVGSDSRLNSSGDDVYWIALQQGPWFDVGTYTGDAPNDVTVTLGRQPDYITMGQVTGTIAAFFKTGMQAGSLVSQYVGAMSDVNALTIQSTGFLVTGDANGVGETFVWAALYDLPGSTRHGEFGTYTGNATQPRTIELGRQPRCVFIHDETSGTALGFKVDQMAAGDFGDLGASYSMTSNGITLVSTGFQPGSFFNSNGSVYNWFVIYE